MENSNRIQINGVWYVAETATPQAEVKTVDWLISKLQKLSESGFGNAEVTIDLDWGNDYDTVNDVHIMDAGRVHIS